METRQDSIMSMHAKTSRFEAWGYEKLAERRRRTNGKGLIFHGFSLVCSGLDIVTCIRRFSTAHGEGRGGGAASERFLMNKMLQNPQQFIWQ